MKVRSLFAFVLFFLTTYAFAFEAFIVQEIKIEGLQRISEGTLLNYLPLQIGDTLDKSESAFLINTLYETKFFKDITLSKVENTLIVKVIENPAIATISVMGNTDLSTEQILSSLKELGISEGAMFDRSVLEQVRNELERAYFSHGKYAVSIETTIDKLPNNRVSIQIKIEEGLATRIKEITVVGNHYFTDTKLLRSFSLSPSHAFSWITRSDQYDKHKLHADLEVLRNFYLDRGYLDFHILSTQVSISPDKRDIFITINVEEGGVYRVSSINITGNTVLPEQDLLSLVTIRSGDVFSRAIVADIVKLMMSKLGQEGYSLAKVNPVPELDPKTHQVAIDFFVEPNNKIYVRRIDFEGNTRTKDDVLRKYLTQQEGALINTKQIENSRVRLNKTGFFKEVAVDTHPVSGISDQVDLLYNVTETSSGELGGGIGYSDVDKLIFNLNVSNKNFLGTGNSVDFRFNHSKSNTTYDIGYQEPFFTLDGMSFGFDMFYTKSELSEISDVTKYSTKTYGSNLNFSYPVTEHSRLNYGLGYQSTELKFDDQSLSSIEMKNFESVYGRHHNDITAVLGWSYNNLDRYYFPENGTSHAVGGAATVPGSDLLYYRVTYHGKYYKGLGKGYVFTLAGNLGYGNGYSKTKALPFYKHFFVGGAHSVRGFVESSLGPKDSLQNPFGGNALVSGTVGVILPNFIKQTNSVRTQLFIDGGQVYDLKNKYRLDEPTLKRNPTGLRYSMGVSFAWMSPWAPLVFTYAIPLNQHDGDKIKRPSFTFGTVF